MHKFTPCSLLLQKHTLKHARTFRSSVQSALFLHKVIITFHMQQLSNIRTSSKNTTPKTCSHMVVGSLFLHTFPSPTRHMTQTRVTSCWSRHSDPICPSKKTPQFSADRFLTTSVLSPSVGFWPFPYLYESLFSAQVHHEPGLAGG